MYIVRHAETKIEPNIPIVDWRLSESAIKSIRKMLNGTVLDDVQRVYHSPLLKARDTARIIGELYGIRTETSECLREVDRSFGYVQRETHFQQVSKYLSGIESNYFEKYENAQDRIVTCLRNLLSAAGGKSVMVVSHGIVLTLLYSYLLGVRLSFEDWQKLRMPDLSIINLETFNIEKGFYSQNRITGQI